MIEIARRFAPLAMAIFFLAAAAVLWGETFRDDGRLGYAGHAMGPAFFPRIVLTGMALLALLVIADTLRRPGGKVKVAGGGRVLALIAITAAYGIAIGWIGFLIASFAFIVASSFALGYRRISIVAPVAAVYAVAVWYLFQEILLIILPSSPWFNSF